MKHCPKCNQDKEKTEFYPAKRYDGLRAYCKDCCKSLNQSLTNYQRNYYQRRYKEDESFRQRVLDNNAKHRRRERDRTHEMVYEALKTGRLKKSPCVVCENPKVHGHHKDYSKPLEVVWLCPKHHRAAHL